MTDRANKLLDRLEQLCTFTVVCYVWGIISMLTTTATMFFFIEHSAAVFSVYCAACLSIMYVVGVLTESSLKECRTLSAEVDDLLNYEVYLRHVENLPYLQPKICSCCRSVMHVQIEPMRNSEDQYFLLCDVCGSVNFTLKILQR